MPHSRIALSSFSSETTTAVVIDSYGPASATWSVTTHFSRPAPLCGASFADMIFMGKRAPCVNRKRKVAQVALHTPALMLPFLLKHGANPERGDVAGT
jgi:hypothetical protein